MHYDLDLCSLLVINTFLSTQGDASEGFKFSGCLPLVVAPIIDPIAAVFSIVFRLRHSAPAEGQGVNSKTQSMLGSDSADANRRR